MAIEALLVELDGLGIRLAIEGDQLVMQAPRGVLTPPLRTRVMGFKAELVDRLRRPSEAEHWPPARPLDFSLFYFASEATTTAESAYRLLLDGARFADTHGFQAVWVPERHFHPLGGLFPNAALAAAALATITTNVALRAGSVVLPLHDPVRVAEEWAMVDQLSNGRVGLAFASGWHARDFVFAPDKYQERKRHMLEALDTVLALWRGEAVTRPDGTGHPVSVSTHPRPLQAEPPVWLTAIGNPETFIAAGVRGCFVLTTLLGQEPEELARKIALYRDARQSVGLDPAQGRVTLMMHTYLGAELDEVRDRVRLPFCRYLEGTLDLLGDMAQGRGASLDARVLDDADRQALLDHAFERYWRTAALLGTEASVKPLIAKLSAMGVDELGCLVDFGLPADDVMAGLERLDALRRSCRQSAVVG